MSAPELNNKYNISLGAIVSIVSISFFIGSMSVGILGLNDKIKQEIGGLRSDMEREIYLLRQDMDKEDNILLNETRSVNSRIDRKLSNHEAIYHKEQ